mgnify:FL=1
MFKVLKNLKKTWVSVLMIIILLCIQAATDLALPEYTSKIVNIGIQQGGIENTIPEIVRETTMKSLELIAGQEKDTIINSYTKISKENLSNNEYEKYVKKYPALEKENLYVVNDLSKEEKEKLHSVISKLLIAIYSQKMAAQMQNQNENYLSDNSMNSLRQSQMEEMPDSIIEQIAIQEIKSEYEDIGINMENYQINYILMTGLQMLGIALISMATAVIIMLLSSKVAAKLGATLREKIYKKVLTFSSKEIRQFSTASLITRSTNDIQQIQMLMSMLFRVVVYAPIIGFGGFFKVLNNSDGSMAWIIGVAIFAILVIVMTLFIVAMPKFKKLQDLIDKLNMVSREILTGLPVIRAFNKEKDEEKRFTDANRDLMKSNMFVNKAMSLMMPTLMLVMNGISLLIIWVGGHGVDQGIMKVGDMMAFIQYTMQIVMSFLMISMISIMLPRASVSAKRINEVLETEPDIKDISNPKKFDKNKKGLVEFKNVSFKYPDADEELLTDINFTAKPGETTAIIGNTGSGKSTIINLIPRFYDVTAGELLIDGVNIKEVSQKDLRDIIGFVPQKGILFSGTIESNIKYSNENMSDERMKEAAEIAQATEFIEAKPEQYDSEIAQGGNNVSGGQKQRVAIARAIAKDPEIFVFDDSFSALDYKTDSKLREALKEKTENKTVIIVAQRINTILNADQIIVLEDGKVVGKGTHKELMQKCETYRQIALSQLSKEELE